jgi:hypothetical protein
LKKNCVEPGSSQDGKAQRKEDNSARRGAELAKAGQDLRQPAMDRGIDPQGHHEPKER